MKRIAIPVIAGVITSAIHTLVLIPVYYVLYKRWEQWRESGRDRRTNDTSADQDAEAEVG